MMRRRKRKLVIDIITIINIMTTMMTNTRMIKEAVLSGCVCGLQDGGGFGDDGYVSDTLIVK